VPISLIRLLDSKTILVGVINVATNAIETPEAVAAVLTEATGYAEAERIQACTNCGMAPMTLGVAYGKLRALAEGAALARKSLA
jgi:5-methyltetrahydropteroyltriglutamate--homocysteine methyltransferase